MQRKFIKVLIVFAALLICASMFASAKSNDDPALKKWLTFIKNLPSDIIESRHIVDGAVSEQDLANGSVTQDKILNQSVSLDKINTEGASSGDALMFNGSSLAWSNPQQSSQNGPLAYAFINKYGKKISGTDNISATLDSTGYSIAIEGEDYYPGKYLVFVTPNSPCAPQISRGEGQYGSIRINFYSFTNTDIQTSDFQIIIYKTNYSPVLSKYYKDSDNDGYGSTDFIMAEGPEGDYTAVKDGDFDDQDSNSYPGAPEMPDGKDNDGDGIIDEDLEGTIYYMDEDQDGYGKTEYGYFGLEYSDFKYLVQPEYPYTALVSGDWDDLNSEIHPGATDVPDGIDNDCDGTIDEDFMPITVDNVSYDLYTGQDLSIQLPLQDSVSRVTYNNVQLTEGTDYIYEEGLNNKIIISKSFMQKLAVGEHTFTIDFETSWRGTPTVTVTDSDPRAKDLINLVLIKGSEDSSGEGNLNPRFTAKNYEYTASITDGTNYVSIIATPAEGTTVEIKCGEQTYPNGEITNLIGGTNIIEVIVSEEGKDSKVYTIDLSISMVPPTKTTPASGSIVRNGEVIHIEMQGDAVYYTLDGTTPSQTSQKYNAASGIVATGNMEDIITIKAIQVRNGIWSEVATFTYTIGEGILDSDEDGVPDINDNAPFIFNPDQLDSDGDGVGDVADSDPYNPDIQ
ncbi:MAG: MopE-related protein [Ignavibacteriales bacterium]